VVRVTKFKVQVFLCRDQRPPTVQLSSKCQKAYDFVSIFQATKSCVAVTPVQYLDGLVSEFEPLTRMRQYD